MYNTILVVVDRYIKINLYILTIKIYIIVNLTLIFRDKVVRYYSLLRSIVSDRGSIFTS
jgi:hypothetical protein